MSKTHKIILLFLYSLVVGFAFVYTYHIASAAVYYDTTDQGIGTQAFNGVGSIVLEDETPYFFPSGTFTLGSVQASIVYVTGGGRGPDTEFTMRLFDDSGPGARDCTAQTVTLGEAEAITWGATDPVLSPVVWEFTGTQCEMENTGGSSYQIKNQNSNILFVGTFDNEDAVAYTIIGDAGPDAPTTEFNEVIDYVYEPNLDNAFGTSTVGAIFSIAQPDWVSSIGYDLLDPTGTVVDTDFVNDPVAGTYTISKEYDFDTTGVYTVRAWFMQNVGGTYQKVINPTTLSIIINTPTWTFDPVTGDLVPSASTTIATSTLLAFKVDCPDDLIIGGLCKLVVGFFVPSPAAIQGVSVAFNNLMSKAPFSFFTQSKQVLDAVQPSGSSLGGTLSLTAFGDTFDVISSSTASNIGLGSSQISFLNTLTSIALYLLLAWYLYWRIASIFGV